MERKERLAYCSICTNRSFSPQNGIVCSLTNEPATFVGRCADFDKDEKEEKIVKIQQNANQSDVKKQVRNAITTLIVVGVFFTVMGFIEGFVIDGHDLLFGIVNWVIAAIFIGLGISAMSAPYISLIIGLSVYLLLTITLFVLEPSTLIRGIIWKFAIIYYLIRGIQHAKNIEKKKVLSGDLLDEI